MKAMQSVEGGRQSAAVQRQTGNGLRGGVLGGELAPELLGVGYIIGPRIASHHVAGGVLAYLVLVPLIVLFGDGSDRAACAGRRAS